MYTQQLLNPFQYIPDDLKRPSLLKFLAHPSIVQYVPELQNLLLKHQLLDNLASSLQLAAKYERVSGFFRGALRAVVHPSMDASTVAQVLHISTASVRKAFKLYTSASFVLNISGKHSKFVVKTNYNVNRIASDKNAICQWILEHCRQSSNTNDVSKTKFPNGSFQLLVKHYRESPISSLFQQFQVSRLDIKTIRLITSPLPCDLTCAKTIRLIMSPSLILYCTD